MYKLPSSSEMLECMIDFKNQHEAENDGLYFKNQINDNNMLKENQQIREQQNVELKIQNNNIKKNPIFEINEELKTSQKNRKQHEFEKRKIISTYFQNKPNSDFFKILLNFDKNENYLKYKILYDALKLNDEKMQLSKTDFLKYFFDCTSYEFENKFNINKFEGKKKLLLFHVAKQKLKIDFDIVNILKTIDQFNDFKKIIMDEDQSELFDFAIKKISNTENDNSHNHNDKQTPKSQTQQQNNKDDESKNMDEAAALIYDDMDKYREKMNFIRQTEEGLDEIFKECLESKSGPSPQHIKLLNSINIKPELIKEFEEIGNANNGNYFIFFLFFYCY